MSQNDARKEYEDLVREGIVLSSLAFTLTKKTLLLSDNTRLGLSDIVSVSVQDNSTKINTIRWIAIVVVSVAIFIYDRISKGHIDLSDALLGSSIIGVVIYWAIDGKIDIELVIKTISNEEHIVATVGRNEVSYKDVHYWRGVLSAAGVDWKRNS